VRDYRSKAGIALNLEQQITTDLGMFARAGMSDGGVNEADFTEINRRNRPGFRRLAHPWGAGCH
jgi:high affinity Mn2+ porin